VSDIAAATAKARVALRTGGPIETRFYSDARRRIFIPHRLRGGGARRHLLAETSSATRPAVPTTAADPVAQKVCGRTAP
jgi:hypothetical protein